MSTVVEGSQEVGIDTANGGLGICLPVEGDGLVRPCTNCDHEDGEEDGVDDTHGVGEEANVGGGG